MTESTTARRARAGARLLIGAVVSVVAVIAVLLAIAAPWPRIAHEPVAVAASPAPDEAVVVCDGALFAAGRNARSADEITVAARSTPLVATDGGAEAADLPLRSPDVEGSGGAPAYSAQPQGRAATALAAGSSARVAQADLSGFAVDACRPPLFESWLVGGDTSIGTSDLVVVANPGDVAATVEITVYGATGPVVPPGGTAVAIAARTQRVIPLAGLASGEESPVLRITATGAPVRASMQSSHVRTLVPGGVDQQSAVAAAAERQVIPGVVVTAPPGAAGASDAATIVRILAPAHAGQAIVTVTAVGAATPATPPATVPLAKGIPTELELSGLAVGSYVLTVDASVAAVAAVWQATGFGAGSDFAWLTSAPALDGASLVAVPAGPSPTLQLANPSADAATVTVHVVRGGEADRSVEVPAGGSAALPLGAGTVVRVDPGDAGEVHAQVSFWDAGALAGFAAWPSDASAGPVRVYP